MIIFTAKWKLCVGKLKWKFEILRFMQISRIEVSQLSREHVRNLTEQRQG
jgi:hypothetical protein